MRTMFVFRDKGLRFVAGKPSSGEVSPVRSDTVSESSSKKLEESGRDTPDARLAFRESEDVFRGLCIICANEVPPGLSGREWSPRPRAERDGLDPVLGKLVAESSGSGGDLGKGDAMGSGSFSVMKSSGIVRVARSSSLMRKATSVYPGNKTNLCLSPSEIRDWRWRAYPLSCEPERQCQ